jgi:CheY-like chemotaxis protein
MSATKILIVDDDKSLANLLRLNLLKTGRYEVRVENWPEDALPAAREFQPDLVLLDLIFPTKSGGDVVAQFEADPALKSTPIIFHTAAVRPNIVEEHEGIIGDHPCLAKPSPLDKIIEMIEKHARKPT